MAWDQEIQKTKSILGDIGSVVESGLGIFQQVKASVFPSEAKTKSTADVYTPTTATKGAVTSQPAVQGVSSLFAGMNFKVLAVIGVIGYLFLASRK